jgi:hypothetical protein
VSHKTSRNRQRQVECAAEHFLRSAFDCINTVRAVKTRFQRQDLFAADCLGKRRMGGLLVALQVTCGKSANVAQRRRKMEAVQWHPWDTVLLGEFRSERSGRGKRHWFRMHQLTGGEWSVWGTEVEVPKEWFRAWKPEGK